ncbi:hypothetical protein Q5H93_03545 [Hymenobacter sp. ASUV-10]|uniref:Uncharacterized protein n=1 Tax=Hymenobacter aranciens TaxID=3063996 RepID=A0ABT9BB71_9BACT|nr:hypothetical protein [Hymenobacter sp. ASUV-10]MDO7873793.1 hypothetical protein [Hymenobacter sp. ASUV-10]
MARPFNTAGGGANTNRNGLEFERSTELRDAFAEHERYKLRGDTVIDTLTDLAVGTLFEKNKLYKNLLAAHGVDYKQLV